MVKRSKKSKSKRIPLRKKHKIIKKVKEHHKKQAKEAKKQAKLGIKGKSKIEKDPGIPNAWPFKEQELAALEARRARALEEIELKKAAKKERAAKRKAGLLDEEDDDELAEALKKAAEYEKSKKQKTLSPRETARRTFYKEFMKVVESSDVIIQVLDARDPLGSRCVEVERMVHEAGPLKRLVLVLNKIDLVPREVVEKWLKYLREELPTVAFKCNSHRQGKKSGKKSRKDVPNAELLQTNNCLGAEPLLQLLRNYSKSQKTKTAITVGVVGFPNVGKSSLINSLKSTEAVSVGAAPGVTKLMQEVILDKHVTLLDCPGVVVAASGDNEASAALQNFTHIEQLADSISPVKEILRLCPVEKLITIYKIAKFSDLDGFLMNVATVRGKLKKGGEVDKNAAARLVIHDWTEGMIPYCTIPTVREASKPAVSNLAKEFDVEKVYKNEASAVIVRLKSVVDTDHVQVPSRPAPAMDVDASVINDEPMEYDESDEDEDEDEQENEDEEMETTAVAVKKGKAANGKLTPKSKKAKAEPAKAKGKKKAAVANGKVSSKKSSKASDDYDFNTDYIDDKANGAAEEDDDDEEMDD